jgi:hypothetical protein
MSFLQIAGSLSAPYRSSLILSQTCWLGSLCFTQIEIVGRQGEAPLVSPGPCRYLQEAEWMTMSTDSQTSDTDWWLGQWTCLRNLNVNTYCRGKGVSANWSWTTNVSFTFVAASCCLPHFSSQFGPGCSAYPPQCCPAVRTASSLPPLLLFFLVLAAQQRWARPLQSWTKLSWTSC